MAALDKLSDIRLAGEVNFADATLITYKDASIPGSALQAAADIERSQLAQEDAAEYPVPLTALRVWDAQQTNLPGTAATDDLAIITGTLGTDVPTVQTSDLKNTTGTQYARFQFALPPEYAAGETVTLRVRAGMITTVASSTATVDAQVYKSDRDGASGSDLCTTSATTINSLTKANVDFTVTATTLSPGDLLDVRLAIAITDVATGTAVIGEISQVEFLLDIVG